MSIAEPAIPVPMVIRDDAVAVTGSSRLKSMNVLFVSYLHYPVSHGIPQRKTLTINVRTS